METLTIDNTTYQVIGSGYFCKTILYTEDLVAKVFFNRKSAQKEYNALKFAAQVNNLLCSPVELIDYLDFQLLILERLKPVSWSEISNKKDLVDKAKLQLKQLHEAGFTHNDIKRPLGCSDLWNNIIVSKEGIRLVDVGEAYIYDKNFNQFKEGVVKDYSDFIEWSQVFLK
jgi:tRNA A-37 threonylcarbamoyl transferase component Bud32